jgi:hypothetical protein
MFTRDGSRIELNSAELKNSSSKIRMKERFKEWCKIQHLGYALIPQKL